MLLSAANSQGLQTTRLGGDKSIKGLVCSTNSASDDKEVAWVVADCETIPRGNQDFDGILNTNIKVQCPQGCQTSEKGRVWGSTLYKDDSSVCKAAIHSGIIKPDEGGLIEIGLEEGQDSYTGSKENGITSEDFGQKWDRSFVVNKYVEKCPIDNFELGNSFLQKSEKIISKQDTTS